MPKLPVPLTALLTAASLLAQSPRLYNERLDRQADDLRRLAESTTNGQFFDTELHNLDALAQPTIDRIFSSARRLALARINRTVTWKNIQTTLESLTRETSLGPGQQAEWDKQAAELRRQVGAARNSLTAATSPASSAMAAEILRVAGDASEILTKAESLASKAGIGKTELRAAESLTALAGEFTSVLDALHRADSAPGAVDSVRRLQQALLRADLDHLTELGRIETRRLAAMNDVNGLLASTRNGLTTVLAFADANDSIESTLNKLRSGPKSEESRRRLENSLFLLNNYAALCARAATPNRLAEARMALESHRHGIRRDALIAQSYEAVLTSGAQRIAAYYKGGIRPEVLAQVAQALATAGLIPAVVSK